MKKKFKLEDLDCANCAAKMEEAIKKIPGVHEGSGGSLRKGGTGLQDLTIKTGGI